MAIDLGNAPIGTPPTTAEQNQIRLALLSLGRQQNLSEVSSAETSRTNLGLGTAAIQNTGSSDGDVLQGDGTITNANAAQIIEIDGDGKARASGKSFGATPSEIAWPERADRVATIKDLMLGGMGCIQVFNQFTDFTTGFTGSGSLSNADSNNVTIQTGTTAGSTAFAGLSITSGLTDVNGNRGSLGTNRSGSMCWRYSSSAGNANLTTYAVFGKTSSDPVGDLTAHGFGFKVSGASNDVEGIYWDGTQMVAIPLVSLGSQTTRLLRVDWDGSGGIYFYVNGVLLGSANDLPSNGYGNKTARYEITNLAATTNFLLYGGQINIQGGRNI